MSPTPLNLAANDLAALNTTVTPLDFARNDAKPVEVRDEDRMSVSQL